MPSWRQGILRRAVSGLLVLGLLLLSATSLSAMPMSHCPAGLDRSPRVALEAAAPPPCPDCPGDPYPDHDKSGDMCCAGAVCMLVPIVSATNVFALTTPTSVHYCTNMDVSIGLTPEPAVGPPIPQA
jgi:hypothetical protein